MKKHVSAKASHYDKEAESYDAFNENNSKQMNQLIEGILKKHSVRTVLDLTCGTGSQVFWLVKRGFEVMGSDISSRMLKIAKRKAADEKLSLKFIRGDMRSIKVGEFDAVITIFNAVGHLTKSDFEVAMRNVHGNLKDEGLYIFDIFNLDYLQDGNNITKLTIDWQKVVGDIKYREIQYSTISQDGVLASYDTYYEQSGSDMPKMSRKSMTLQVYSANELKEMLHRNGFTVINQCNIDGTSLVNNKSERILTIARKGS